MILAGDIGGTKTVLSLLEEDKSGRLICLKEQVFLSQQFLAFNDVLDVFLPKDHSINSACFGIAGPIINQRCQTTNLPWLLEAESLKTKFHGAQVKLLNDLEAMALGMLHLSENELLELNPNGETEIGNIAVIAPGTGLGQALLFWDGNSHQPIATEGGHTDFAPVNKNQDFLLDYLRAIFPDHVSYERILSGDGFSHLYDFICAMKIAEPSIFVPQASDVVDRNAIISQLGIEGADKACVETLRLFVEILGAETGNLTLKSLSTGGVFIGGGICPKIVTALQDGVFIDAFKAKGRFNTLLDKVSIKLSLNPRTPLLGAINYFSR